MLYLQNISNTSGRDLESTIINSPTHVRGTEYTNIFHQMFYLTFEGWNLRSTCFVEAVITCKQ